MTGNNPIKQELTDLNSSLPAGITEPVFSLPTNYFENFAASVLARIKETSAKDELSELSPLLAGISKKNPFTVPENYFNSLDASHALKEEQDLPDFLSKQERAMPFVVPEGYFNTLPEIILARVPRQAKVVSFARRWSQMAVAATVAGIMAVSGLIYFGDKSVSPSVQSQAWFKSKLNNVSDKALEEFIHNTDAVHEQQVLAKTEVKPQEVRTMLKDVSVKEMDAFLDQVPTDDEELSVIN